MNCHRLHCSIYYIQVYLIANATIYHGHHVVVHLPLAVCLEKVYLVYVTRVRELRDYGRDAHVATMLAAWLWVPPMLVPTMLAIENMPFFLTPIFGPLPGLKTHSSNMHISANHPMHCRITPWSPTPPSHISYTSKRNPSSYAVLLPKQHNLLPLCPVHRLHSLGHPCLLLSSDHGGT